jgi:hypothetical protein
LVKAVQKLMSGKHPTGSLAYISEIMEYAGGKKCDANADLRDSKILLEILKVNSLYQIGKISQKLSQKVRTYLKTIGWKLIPRKVELKIPSGRSQDGSSSFLLCDLFLLPSRS